jgi:phosphomannomutase
MVSKEKNISYAEAEAFDFSDDSLGETENDAYMDIHIDEVLNLAC